MAINLEAFIILAISFFAVIYLIETFYYELILLRQQRFLVI